MGRPLRIVVDQAEDLDIEEEPEAILEDAFDDDDDEREGLNWIT